MRKILTLFILLVTTFTAMADNGKYKEYCCELKNKLNVTLSIPDSAISFKTDSSMFFAFTFGKVSEEVTGEIIFMGAPIVKLSENSSAVMMDVEYVSGKRSGNDECWSTPTAWMLYNCNTPWCIPLIRNTGVCNNDGSEIYTQEETAAFMEKISQLRAQYERCLENDKLTHKANCDRIFIVRIPHLDRVTTSSIWPDLSCPKTEAQLKANATECYGVEFNKQSSSEAFKMLFFINGNNTTIDECVAKMAEYIRFE